MSKAHEILSRNGESAKGVSQERARRPARPKKSAVPSVLVTDARSQAPAADSPSPVPPSVRDTEQRLKDGIAQLYEAYEQLREQNRQLLARLEKVQGA